MAPSAWLPAPRSAYTCGQGDALCLGPWAAADPRTPRAPHTAAPLRGACRPWGGSPGPPPAPAENWANGVLVVRAAAANAFPAPLLLDATHLSVLDDHAAHRRVGVRLPQSAPGQLQRLAHVRPVLGRDCSDHGRAHPVNHVSSAELEHRVALTEELRRTCAGAARRRRSGGCTRPHAAGTCIGPAEGLAGPRERATCERQARHHKARTRRVRALWGVQAPRHAHDQHEHAHAHGSSLPIMASEKHSVQLWIYDLTQGMARVLSPMLLGEVVEVRPLRAAAVRGACSQLSSNVTAPGTCWSGSPCTPRAEAGRA